MIVFIGGMQRSGSTFSFNIVREILSRHGGAYQETTPHVLKVIEQAKVEAPQAQHVIVKAHSIDEPSLTALQLGQIRTICTVRRPEDAIASYIEVFGISFEAAIEQFQEWFRIYAQLAPFALTIKYELIERLSLFAAWRIARYVYPSATPLEVFSIWKRNRKSVVKASTDDIKKDAPGVRDIGFSYYDRTTFYHRRHVSSLKPRSAKDTLSSAQIATIRERLEGLIDRRGNLK